MTHRALQHRDDGLSSAEIRTPQVKPQVGGVARLRGGGPHLPLQPTTLQHLARIYGVQ